jgi:hypothetical protein
MMMRPRTEGADVSKPIGKNAIQFVIYWAVFKPTLWVKQKARKLFHRAPLWIKFRRVEYGFKIRNWYRNLID